LAVVITTAASVCTSYYQQC